MGECNMKWILEYLGNVIVQIDILEFIRIIIIGLSFIIGFIILVFKKLMPWEYPILKFFKRRWKTDKEVEHVMVSICNIQMWLMSNNAEWVIVIRRQLWALVFSLLVLKYLYIAGHSTNNVKRIQALRILGELGDEIILDQLHGIALDPLNPIEIQNVAKEIVLKIKDRLCDMTPKILQAIHLLSEVGDKIFLNALNDMAYDSANPPEIQHAAKGAINKIKKRYGMLIGGDDILGP